MESFESAKNKRKDIKTIESISEDKIIELIPELLPLKNIFENNRSHNNQSVYDHTLLVYNKLKELLNDYFQSIIGNYSKKELLLFSSLVHDLGKKETMARSGDKVTFPKHEDAGYKLLLNLLKNYELTEDEKEYILTIVKNHGFFHSLMDLDTREAKELITSFKAKNFNIFAEIVFLTKADILGGDLNKNLPGEFKKRMEFSDNTLLSLRK